jgi:hypothetical protein
MNNDDSIQSIFDHAKKNQLADGTIPKVFATYIEHHPDAQGNPDNDQVYYVNMELFLSVVGNKFQLQGQNNIWRNRSNNSDHPFILHTKLELFITLLESGEVFTVKKINGKLIGGLPADKLRATYQRGLFVDTSFGLKSLSFTLGSVPRPPD